MIVSEIAFVRPIPILNTYKTEARFTAEDGWTIDVHDYGVTLSREERQNEPAVPAFCTCGVGYSVPASVVDAYVAAEAPPEPEPALPVVAPRKGRS